MAGRLTEYSGIDPFTIHQEFYSEKGNPKFNHPFLKAINPTESSVLLGEDNKPVPYRRDEAYTDISILHPTTNYEDGRPDWIFSEGNRKVEIDLNEFNLSFPALVMAYKKGEDIHIAVPLDLVEIAAKDEKCFLGLPAGNYSIIVTNGKESYRKEKKVE